MIFRKYGYFGGGTVYIIDLFVVMFQFKRNGGWPRLSMIKVVGRDPWEPK